MDILVKHLFSHDTYLNVKNVAESNINTKQNLIINITSVSIIFSNSSSNIYSKFSLYLLRAGTKPTDLN